MCGITGILQLDGGAVSPVILKKMTDAIAHRGPDGEGQWIEGNVGLGHRRLAIIDLSPAGHQPMISVNHRYVIAFNGEVYNFKELRIELEALGYQFRSSTDTEVVMNAFAAWGLHALTRFNGMFAIALWDRKEKRLLLARDRYGIKPLYYSIQGKTLSFGSEQKALTAAPDFKQKLDKEALYEYFTFQNIFTDKTLLQGVKLLPPGHYGIVDMKRVKPDLKIKQFWDFDFREPMDPVSDGEYREELDRLFQQAVNRQLVTDVELGSYLSGGIDSGSITAIAAQSYPYIKTFTCGFDLNSASGIELGFDERARAEYMSYKLKTEHYELVLKAGDMERIMPKLAFHLEEPRIGQSYPNYYTSRLASKFVKVVLSGAGGDELFAGYPWRYYRAVVNDDFDHYISKYYDFWQRLIPGDRMSDVFAPILSDVKHVSTRDIFCGVFKHYAEHLSTPADYINHSLYFEAKTFLHGLLVVEDKISMAHGLETRVPFLDNDLVDFAMSCPVRLKLNDLDNVIRINENEPGDKGGKHFEKTKDGKQIVRDVMGKYIPADIANAVKQGFSAPDASWFKGESIDFVRRILLNKNASLYQLLDYKTVSGMINEHLEGRKNNRLLIWSLLNVQTWLDSNKVTS
jgi:asparagine synthase (glutamine-hydrolysing)